MEAKRCYFTHGAPHSKVAYRGIFKYFQIGNDSITLDTNVTSSHCSLGDWYHSITWSIIGQP